MPRGGKLGIRLSISACARLILPSVSSSSSSTSHGSGESASRAGCCKAWRRVNRVGAGEGSGLGTLTSRVADRSRFEGRRLREPVVEERGLVAIDEAFRFAESVALVRSSRA